jgi:trimethylamine--corrinoid protein Co-methyltransferase
MRLKVLGGEDVNAIHRTALAILEQIGMDVRDADTREELVRAGCREGDGNYLRFPQELVARALESVPRRVALYRRDGRNAIDTAAPEACFAPGLNCISVLDHRSGHHRECVLSDVGEAARLCQRLPNIDLATGLGNPADVAPEKQALETVRTIVRETDKPLAFIAHNEVEDEEVWEYLAGIAGGWDALAERPFALDLTGPYSPLELGEEACRRLRHAARRNLPVVCYPALLSGTTGPVTLAGSIAQSSAEILAGLVVHQLAGPGAPVLTASSILPVDLRTGGIVYGSPEYLLAGLGAVDYFEELGVPTWIGAGCSDSHVVDAQAAAEAAVGLYGAMLAGTSFVHNLGFLSAGKTGSLEMLVFGDELAGGARRFASGIRVDDDTLGLEATRRAARDHSFMMDEHTLAHMSTAMWEPHLLSRVALERWQKEGRRLEERLKDRVEELLSGRGG